MATRRPKDDSLEGLTPAQVRRVEMVINETVQRLEKLRAEPGHKERQAANLRAILPSSTSPHSFAYLMGTTEGSAALEAISREHGEGLEALKTRLDAFDASGGYAPTLRNEWTKGGRRGVGARVVRTHVLDEGGLPAWSMRVPEVLREQIESALAQGEMHATFERFSKRKKAEASHLRESFGLKPDISAKAGPTAPAMTLDAIRKRADRAAGKVKQRPSRAMPPRTLAQEVESRKLALATHSENLRKKRAAHAARPDLVSVWEVLKAEEAERRAEKTLRTFEKRLADSRPK
jgi:hypothetical protein